MKSLFVVRFSCLLLSFLLIHSFAFSQNSSPIIINGKAIDAKSHRGVPHLQIINTRNIQRFYGDSLGEFVIQAGKNDSLIALAKGYVSVMICYKDSSLQHIYNLKLVLNKFSIELPEVEVKSNREFNDIHQEAQKLGYDKRDYMVHGVAIAQHPFTYLYDLLSTRAKDERGYAELTNEGKKNALLHELVSNYVDLGILQVDDSQIDLFIDFSSIPEQFLKTASEYEFILYLQHREELFHHRKLPEPPVPK